MFARACSRVVKTWSPRVTAPWAGAGRAIHLQSATKVAGTSSSNSPIRRYYASDAIPEDSAAEAVDPFEEFAEEQEFEEVEVEEFDLENVTEEQMAAAIVDGRAMFEPMYHPHTHGIPAAAVHLRSHHVSLLQMYSHFAVHAAAALGIPTSAPTPLPTQRSLWTVLKGPFVHKKAQENFDRKTHKRLIKAWDAHPDVIERWVRYMEKHALAGVGMRVVRWERAPVGVGKKVEEAVAAAMEAAKLQTPQAQVAALGKEIVKQETTTTANEVVVQATSIADSNAAEAKPAEQPKAEEPKVAGEPKASEKPKPSESA
ncbi:ribosomal protein S10 [Phanerochaete sordida]|uniref:Small ribosomal subunit protein uS10m n=1 Tax=Phanerochaete sordida TaxID=48140 RepID=A0A9P3GC79_9APHY|nr:ribosomal protein S10 [Phanerochaete sordida]